MAGVAALGLLLALGLAGCAGWEDRPLPLHPSPTPGERGTLAPADALAPCTLDELSASLSWRQVEGALSGSIEAANFGKQACRLNGAPQVGLFNENGWRLPIELEAASTASDAVVLDPGGNFRAVASFTWRNGCMKLSPSPLRFEISLPGYAGKLLVFFQDPNGQPLSVVPQCVDSSAPSSLSVGEFKLISEMNHDLPSTLFYTDYHSAGFPASE